MDDIRRSPVRWVGLSPGRYDVVVFVPPSTWKYGEIDLKTALVAVATVDLKLGEETKVTLQPSQRARDHTLRLLHEREPLVHLDPAGSLVG